MTVAGLKALESYFTRPSGRAKGADSRSHPLLCKCSFLHPLCPRIEMRDENVTPDTLEEFQDRLHVVLNQC